MLQRDPSPRAMLAGPVFVRIRAGRRHFETIWTPSVHFSGRFRTSVGHRAGRVFHPASALWSSGRSYSKIVETLH